jgi:hypothetical protein
MKALSGYTALNADVGSIRTGPDRNFLGDYRLVMAIQMKAHLGWHGIRQSLRTVRAIRNPTLSRICVGQ